MELSKLVSFIGIFYAASGFYMELDYLEIRDRGNLNLMASSFPSRSPAACRPGYAHARSWAGPRGPHGDSNRAWRISQGGNLGSSRGCDCADDRTLDETRNNVPEDARDVACARVPGLLRWAVDWHPKKEHRGVCGVVLWTEVTVSLGAEHLPKQPSDCLQEPAS